MTANSIAVIMSVYRSDDPEMFKVAIDSILCQSIPCTLLIYRDGLLPECLNVVLESYLENESVHVIFNEENKGLATGLNTLIDYSLTKGFKYIARMDSDDISRPQRLKVQFDFLEANADIDVLGTSCREFGATFALDEKHLPEFHDDLTNFSITRCPFIHPTVMFRSNVFRRGYRYPVNTTLTEDMALWFELLNAGFKFSNINEVLLDYRLNETTISRRKGIGKAFSEINIRLRNMFSLNKFNLKNCLLIGGRIIFHLMPDFLVKVAYKKIR
ncbi:glycosyltransferase [Vibrio diabolicus]|uniref:glycosyltransferase n=1 Tax=Vibrio diabolicus TaxID=50719 RepID=UPI00211AD7EF|nr:glycosyltransferase [Vibrio diabolicus]MCG6223057.1 glycosyltransferase [Vibrio diabolicus]